MAHSTLCKHGVKLHCAQPRGAFTRRSVLVRAELLKKPDLKKPDTPSNKLFSDAPAQAATGQPQIITVEYQRQRAKEMTKYFQEKKIAATSVESKVFGFTPANEINNGRWTMFGLAVGMLTEYATGVDFVDQLKLLVSYLGIADLE